jgi:hypothetical protein
MKKYLLPVGMLALIISAPFCVEGQNTAKKNSGIRIIEATYGDKSTGKTCSPDLSVCKGLSKCEFNVDDGLCTIEAPVKNLEVVWDCGPGTTKKARAAAKGTNMSFECGN